MLKILKYSDIYANDVILCLEKLQDFIIKLDTQDLNIRTQNYWKNRLHSLCEQMKNQNWVMYIAFFDDMVVGCIAWIIGTTEDVYKDEFKYIKMWYVLELFVDEQFRGKNIWISLMNTMEEYFKVNNCEYNYLDVFALNVSAHLFYKKLWYSERMITMSKKINESDF